MVTNYDKLCPIWLSNIQQDRQNANIIKTMNIIVEVMTHSPYQLKLCVYPSGFTDSAWTKRCEKAHAYTNTQTVI